LNTLNEWQRIIQDSALSTLKISIFQSQSSSGDFAKRARLSTD
jgi:hypothetical protein